MSGLGSPHDAFFKRLLAGPAAAEAFLRDHLPAAIVALLAPGPPEPQPASFVDRQLDAHYSDLLFRFRTRDGEDLFVYVLVEHKSSPDPEVAFQLLRYQTQIWAAHAAAGRGRPYPPVVPLVVYHGDAPWTVPPTFAAGLFTERACLRPHLPDFAYVLVDLGRIADEALSRQVKLRIRLLALKYIFRDELPDLILPMLLALAAAGEDMDEVLALLAYIVKAYEGRRRRLDSEIIRSALRQAFPKEEERIMTTLADEWRAEGLAQGRAQGMAQGQAEQKRDAVLRVVEMRFGAVPASLRERIKAADPGTIDAWYERVFTASTLPAIFDPNAGNG